MLFLYPAEEKSVPLGNVPIFHHIPGKLWRWHLLMCRFPSILARTFLPPIMGLGWRGTGALFFNCTDISLIDEREILALNFFTLKRNIHWI